MPKLSCTIAALMLVLSWNVSAFAAETLYPDLASFSMDELIAQIPEEQLAKLHSADFMTVRDLAANLPHGSLVIKRGVIASYKGHEEHTAGIVIGEIEMVLDRLPADGYNAFPPELFDANGAFHATLEKSFMYASPVSQAYMKEIGFVAALRKWEVLKPEEQRNFTEILAQSWPGIWRDESAQTMARRPILRNPVGGEVYGATWVRDWPGTAPGSLTRIDMWVEADGKTTRGVEHASGKLLAQHPWAPEDGALVSEAQQTAAAEERAIAE